MIRRATFDDVERMRKKPLILIYVSNTILKTCPKTVHPNHFRAKNFYMNILLSFPTFFVFIPQNLLSSCIKETPLDILPTTELNRHVYRVLSSDGISSRETAHSARIYRACAEIGVNTMGKNKRQNQNSGSQENTTPSTENEHNGPCCD